MNFKWVVLLLLFVQNTEYLVGKYAYERNDQDSIAPLVSDVNSWKDYFLTSF